MRAVIDVKASVPLQKLLYFNVFLSVAFAGVHICICAYKLSYLTYNPISLYLLPAVLGVWAAVEVLRLRLGYIGNLRERVPELSAFFLVCVFPQLPLCIYLTVLQNFLNDWHPIDLAVGVWPLFFIVMELHFSLRAIRGLIAAQTGDFYRLCVQESLTLPANELAARIRTMAATGRDHRSSQLVARRAIAALTQERTDGYAPVPVTPAAGADAVGASAAAGTGVGDVAAEGAAHLAGALAAAVTGTAPTASGDKKTL